MTEAVAMSTALHGNNEAKEKRDYQMSNVSDRTSTIHETKETERENSKAKGGREKESKRMLYMNLTAHACMHLRILNILGIFGGLVFVFLFSLARAHFCSLVRLLHWARRSTAIF